VHAGQTEPATQREEQRALWMRTFSIKSSKALNQLRTQTRDLRASIYLIDRRSNYGCWEREAVEPTAGTSGFGGHFSRRLRRPLLRPPLCPARTPRPVSPCSTHGFLGCGVRKSESLECAPGTWGSLPTSEPSAPCYTLGSSAKTFAFNNAKIT
jgi:hypothetical protein